MFLHHAEGNEEEALSLNKYLYDDGAKKLYPSDHMDIFINPEYIVPIDRKLKAILKSFKGLFIIKDLSS